MQSRRSAGPGGRNSTSTKSSKHKSQSNVVPTRCTRAMSHSPGRKQAADQEASRVYCVADEEEIHDAHRDLDRCAGLLDSLMQASTEAHRNGPRPRNARPSKASSSRSVVGDQSAPCRHSVAPGGARVRSRSWNRSQLKKKDVGKKPAREAVSASRPLRIGSTPLQGVSVAGVKQAGHVVSGRRAAPVRAGGRRCPPSTLEWTCDSGSDDPVQPSSAAFPKSIPVSNGSSNKLRRASSDPSLQETAKGQEAVASADGLSENLSTYKAMETRDLLQALLTRTIDTGDGVLQQMVLTLCSTALKPWLMEDPPEVIPGPTLSSQSTHEARHSQEVRQVTRERNDLEEENVVLRKKLQEALHKAQVAKDRLRDAEKFRTECTGLKDKLVGEQELTTRLRDQLAKKTSELEEAITRNSRRSEAENFQSRLPQPELPAREASLPTTADSTVSDIGQHRHVMPSSCREHLSSQPCTAVSHLPAAGVSDANSVSTHNDSRYTDSVLLQDRVGTVSDSSFMHLPMRQSLPAKAMMSDPLYSSESSGSELTMANVHALNKVYPAVTLSDHVSNLTSYSRPEKESAHSMTLEPKTTTAVDASSNHRQSEVIRSAEWATLEESQQHRFASESAQSTASKVVMDLDLDSSVSTSGTVTMLSEYTAVSNATLGEYLSNPSHLAADRAVSASDVTGSCADEDFQVGMAALDAGIERLRQQLHSCKT